MGDYRVVRGDTFAIDYVAHQPVPNQANPQDLTGAALWWTAKYRTDADDTDALAVFHKSTATTGVVVTNAAAGLLTVTVDPADWAAYQGPGNLVFDLQSRDGTGKVVTLERGTLIVDQDVTRQH